MLQLKNCHAHLDRQVDPGILNEGGSWCSSALYILFYTLGLLVVSSNDTAIIVEYFIKIIL